jgi:hypothetical protein
MMLIKNKELSLSIYEKLLGYKPLKADVLPHTSLIRDWRCVARCLGKHYGAQALGIFFTKLLEKWKSHDKCVAYPRGYPKATDQRRGRQVSPIGLSLW